MATNRTDEELDRLGSSANRTSQQTDRLTRALDRAGSAFGGIIRGAPQTLGDFTEGLTKLIGTGGPVNDAMKFADGYVGVWQELTRGGVNFGNQLDRMIISAGAANIRLDMLAKITRDSGGAIAGLGLTANQGLTNFLSRQGSFFRDQERQFGGVQRRLLALGLTTQDINDRFLQFDTIDAIRGRRVALQEEQRINQATQFAEEMDRLAKLTGKQADQLAADAVELSRQGNIYARTRQLPEKTREVFQNTIQQLKEIGPAFGSLATDILTRGFIDPNDPAVLMLNSFAPELVNTLYEARRAQQRNDFEEAVRLRDLAAVQAAQVRDNTGLINQAVLGTATSLTRGAQDIYTGMNSSAQALRLEEIGRNFQSSMGRAATSADELAKYLNGVLEQEKKLQLEGVDSQKIIRAYNEALIGLQALSRTVQERTVTGFANMGTAVSDTIIRAIRSTDVRSMTDAALSELTGAIDWWTARDTDIVDRIRDRQEALSTLAQTTTDEEAAAKLLDYSSQIGAIAAQLNDPTSGMTTEQARSRLYELDQESRQIRTPEMTVHADNVNISRTGRITEAIRQGAASGASEGGRQGNNIGTLGRTGSFFANFGPGTNVRLHGVEGVFRPNHIEDIMEKSSRGTINAMINDMLGRGLNQNQVASVEISQAFRNITSSLDGRLNTLRANISKDIRETSPVNTEMIAEQLNTALGSMPANMRKAFEDALGNTIKSPIEQLVAVSSMGTQYQEKVYKNTRGISQDYLRGA